MNAQQLIQHMKPAPALAKRVRVVNDPRITGTVFDVGEDGLIYWVGDDHSCHVSAPDYVEGCK